MNDMDKTKSSLLIILAASLWGIISVFNRMLTEAGYSQLEIVFIRSFVALAFTAIYIYFKDKSLLRIKLKDVWCFIGSGVISLTFFNICYFNAMQENISVAAVLLYTAPAFVVIMSAVLFKEKITFVKVLSLFVMITGCIFVTGMLSDSSLRISGRCFLFGIGSGIGYALYSIFGRYAINRGYKSETISLYTFVMATVACMPFMNTKEIVAQINIIGVIGAVGIGVVCCFLPYLLYTKGLSGVTNGQASVMATIEPVVATFVSLIYGETFGINNLIGILMVAISIVMINFDIKPKSGDI